MSITLLAILLGVEGLLIIVWMAPAQNDYDRALARVDPDALTPEQFRDLAITDPQAAASYSITGLGRLLRRQPDPAVEALRRKALVRVGVLVAFVFLGWIPNLLVASIVQRVAGGL
jgi:hypothetical protein